MNKPAGRRRRAMSNHRKERRRRRRRALRTDFPEDSDADVKAADAAWILGVSVDQLRRLARENLVPVKYRDRLDHRVFDVDELFRLRRSAWADERIAGRGSLGVRRRHAVARRPSRARKRHRRDAQVGNATRHAVDARIHNANVATWVPGAMAAVDALNLTLRFRRLPTIERTEGPQSWLALMFLLLEWGDGYRHSHNLATEEIRYLRKVVSEADRR
ncbi:MAG: hypothetical protein AAF550_11735 [Myxococcota bacterium]